MASPTGSYSLALALVCTAGAARAQGPSDVDRKLAQSLFDHARQLLEAGQASAACPKFAESHRLDPAGGSLLNLAVCHEREGKTGSAWFEYNDALSLAIKEGRPDREQIARERLAALEPKLVRLAVAPAPGAEIEGLEVTLDGVALRRAVWGTPMVIDPGAHGVDARAPGRGPWSTTVTLEGEGRLETVEVPPLAPARPAPPPPPRTADVTTRTLSPWVYALGTGAAAGSLAAAITGVMALERQFKANRECVSERNYCSQEGLDAGESARTLAWVSTVSFGAALVAAAAIPFVPRVVERRRVRLDASAAPGHWVVGLEGHF